MSIHLIHSARVVSGNQLDDDGWVLLREGRVESRGVGDSWRAIAAETQSLTLTDAHGHWLTPGFIDIHGHGGAGCSYDEGESAIRTALDMHQHHGTTRAVLSLVSAPLETLETRLASIGMAMRRDARVLGAHCEGPFLDPGHKGAHDPSTLAPPHRETVNRLLEAGSGVLRQITIAPELPGGLDAVREYVDAGVAVALGHTNADYADTLAAFDAGATILTHAFNAMNGLHHREPGPVGAALHTAGVTLEVINDGTHVHPEVVRVLFASAPHRIALITDSMAAAGQTDGDYRLGSLAVTVTGGVARLTNGGAIAGSTLTQDEALRRSVHEVGVDVRDAVRALTETPAAVIGRSGDLGRLEPGYAADAVLLDSDFRVLDVWSAGIALSER